MRNLLKLDLPLNLLYSFPNINLLVKRIRIMENDPTADFKEADTTKTMDEGKSKDWNVDVETVLDDSITVHDCKTSLERACSPKKAKYILLTGATGFLGAFILQSLLDAYPYATIICLTRAANPEKALERVIANLKAHHIYKDVNETRLEAICGDLSLKQAGVSDGGTWDRLCREIDLIVHNGALVHWVYPYQKLKSMNVGGTVELLRLATTFKIKPFHFVSTTAVFESPYYSSFTSPVLEKDMLIGGAGLSVGYGQSKYVAEKLILEANRRGLPTCIFRPGYIVGHSVNGVMNVDDFLVRLLKGCIELGKFPDMRNKLNMCTVDFVSSAIVHIIGNESNYGKCFHMSNPNIFRYSDFYMGLRRYGYKVERAEYLKWCDSLETLTLSGRDNALFPLLHFVMDDLPTKSRGCTLDATQLFEALEDSNIVCHDIRGLLGTYLSYLVHIEHFEAPCVNADGLKVKELPACPIKGPIHVVERSRV